jgi:hypothetical protein
MIHFFLFAPALHSSMQSDLSEAAVSRASRADDDDDDDEEEEEKLFR